MIGWLLKLFNGSRLAAWCVAVLLVVVVFAALFGVGYKLGWSAKGNQVDAKALSQEKDRVRVLEQMERDNAQLTIDLAAARAAGATTFLTLRQELPRVSTPIITIPPPGMGDPQCTVSRGFVRLWNDAIAARVPAPTGGAPGAAGTAERDPADDASSGIEPAGLLENHLTNAEHEHANRLQCERLIEWHHAHD